ncbi:hypothetical protein Ga0080574_TMP1095 [Salipiger abyssi]|uniref:Uncharacterized protein n=1 Tax=Salipiger abyssi TaxID=1250539 RepID=A0A1P8UPV4_9RHOB|nr:hypothetical protein Ga0080574_TMP1095 [Salipiger abyssi]
MAHGALLPAPCGCPARSTFEIRPRRLSFCDAKPCLTP